MGDYTFDNFDPMYDYNSVVVVNIWEVFDEIFGNNPPYTVRADDLIEEQNNGI